MWVDACAITAFECFREHLAFVPRFHWLPWCHDCWYPWLEYDPLLPAWSGFTVGVKAFGNGTKLNPTLYDSNDWINGSSNRRIPNAILRVGWLLSLNLVHAARSAFNTCCNVTLPKPTGASFLRWLNSIDKYRSWTSHDNTSANARAIPLRRSASNTCISDDAVWSGIRWSSWMVNFSASTRSCFLVLDIWT